MCRSTLVVLVFFFCWSWSFRHGEASVSYDSKSFIINGRKQILFSGSIHYPRSTPGMWPDLIQKAKDGGLNVIQTYVFWNGHEPSRGRYFFRGRYDLVKFVKLVQQAGLYVHLRIGPYICAEWNFGGFPIWLKYVPGISFRTDNEPFKYFMNQFTTKIVDMMKAEKLFAPQGGPIILSQIENEYKPVEDVIGAAGKRYVKWTAKMAADLQTGVPWVMCKQDDAPNPVINTCNGFYCHNFSPTNKKNPKMWTEAWTGWFTEFGGPVPRRPVEDLAFAVVEFIQSSGSFINYYMYHGGTNFGRTAGGPFVATSYDYDAPIDEYGLVRQPKWGHLKDLHWAIRLSEEALLSGEPNVTYFGQYQEARVFESSSGGCAAFLTNRDAKHEATVVFRNKTYTLPSWSISILHDCKTTSYNTAMVNAQTALTKMVPVQIPALSWQAHSEEIGSSGHDSFQVTGLLEQINVTQDTSDYLWCRTEVSIAKDLKDKSAELTVMSAGHALHVFVNGESSGKAYGSSKSPRLTLKERITLKAGVNHIVFLSISVGLPNIGPHFETWSTGVLGPVMLKVNGMSMDLTWKKWSYKVGLKGEKLKLHTAHGRSNGWVQGSLVSQKKPLTWFKATFHAPSESSPLALDLSHMGKGQAWINGKSIGRFWPAFIAIGHCNNCTYNGYYNERKCSQNCASPSQSWYHVPRSWLRRKDNLLVVFEEWGGDPNSITLVSRVADKVCGDVHVVQPELASDHVGARYPKLHLSCDAGQVISRTSFASFGTPQGSCGSYQIQGCHAQTSMAVFNKKCVGENNCTVTVSPKLFKGDPCPSFRKKLAVEMICN